MNREGLAAGAGLVVVAIVVGLAAGGGVGPFGDDPGGDVGDFPTATETPTPGAEVGDGAGAGGDGDADASLDDVGTAEERPTEEPFALWIDSVESCGRTCRDVTATLENRQDRRATGTTVYTRIHAGNGTDGDVVWEGQHEVGTLGAGESDTETHRVELSYFDAVAIQRADGWVTIVTSIDTDRRTVTFRERREVA